MRQVLSLGLTLMVLAGCAQAPLMAPAAVQGPVATSTRTLKTGVPLYRVFRGVKRGDVSYGRFVDDLQQRFIPAAPATHAKNGLVAYLPALPAQPKPAGIPDEFAIVVYESQAAYDQAKATPAGKAYSDLHWDLFDKAGSKSVSAVSLESTGNQLQADTGYDVMQQPTDWQQGYTTFYVGLRQAALPADQFLGELTKHVGLEKQSFGSRGLNGLIVVATPDYFVAYQNWPSQTAYLTAMGSVSGQTVVKSATRLMKTLQYSAATEFQGAIRAGQVVNTKFTRR